MKGFCLEIWGDFACFTRPEMKVERVSYDVITPSAARNIYQAIFWKPAIRWRITQIDVISPIKWTNIRRNEVSSKNACFIEEARQQRAALVLRDVCYRIYAEFDFIPPEERIQQTKPETAPNLFSEVNEPNSYSLFDAEENALYHESESVASDEKPAKYAAMFDRRATKGQTFTQPYLGCREFACNFRLLKAGDSRFNEYKPIQENRDLGWTLFDMDYSNPKDIKPMFYRPQMVNGIIKVPHPKSEEVVS